MPVLNQLILLIFTVVLFGYWSDFAAAVRSMCPSNTGYYVLEGREYTPVGKDECTTCYCGGNGTPILCNTIPCTPPVETEECPRYAKEEEGCCQYKCLADLPEFNETQPNNDMQFMHDNPDITPDYSDVQIQED